VIFCVLDTETTGLDPIFHEVIQVAAILCDGQLNELDRISFKLRPKFIERASEKALEVNGYHPRTWKPDFFSHRKALNHLNKFLNAGTKDGSSLIMVGQNVKFDYEFMKALYDREDQFFPFAPETLDLIMVAKMWSAANDKVLKRFSLKHLAEFTNQVNTKPHDAEADAEVTLDILRWFVDDLKKGTRNDKRRFSKYSSIKI